MTIYINIKRDEQTPAHECSPAIPGYGAVSTVSLRNPVSRIRAQERRKRNRLEIESEGALVQSRINTYLT